MISMKIHPALPFFVAILALAPGRADDSLTGAAVPSRDRGIAAALKSLT